MAGEGLGSYQEQMGMLFREWHRMREGYAELQKERRDARQRQK